MFSKAAVKRPRLSLLKRGHSTKQWNSSSIQSHTIHFRSFLTILLHVPRSTLNICELSLILVVATLRALFVMSRYDSNWKDNLICLNRRPSEVKLTWADYSCINMTIRRCLNTFKIFLSLATACCCQIYPNPQFSNTQGVTERHALLVSDVVHLYDFFFKSVFF